MNKIETKESEQNLMPISPRDLPAVGVMIGRPELAERAREVGEKAVVAAVREVIAEARERILGEEAAQIDRSTITPAAISRRALELLDRSGPGLRRAINATGILLHTGLGRAPLSRKAIEAIVDVASGYSNLEFDLDSGRRGARTTHVEKLLGDLLGCEAAAVVNNNAAATVIALKALACDKEAIVSRGQLVEIGGSFRLPEIFEVSGAKLKEVGTTNKTRIGDYDRAIGPETAMILRVHTSNYRIVGFVEQPGIRELVELARARGLYFVDDVGSGAIAPGSPPRVTGEPTASESLAAGADLVLFSGDKLLGGPQCGILAGRRGVVDRIRTDPLMRALRADKTTLAALEATLKTALDPEFACKDIPLWLFLNTPVESLIDRAERLAQSLRNEGGFHARAIATEAYLGGGSVPQEALPSRAVRVEPPFPAAAPRSVEALTRNLRVARPAIVPRVERDSIVLDLAAVFPREDQEILARFLDIIKTSCS